MTEPSRHPPPSAIGARYAALPRTGTTPELQMRRLLHARGLRYRVHAPVQGLPRRRIDILFTKARVAVSVDGCFWHGCPEHWVPPRTNREWWDWKVAKNRARDADTDRRLAELGYTSLRIWKHVPPVEAAQLVADRLAQANRED
ncbi:very short patch repair endonuclease [Ornithinimicrobium cavernae]|uniref:very short patch repair endonuclease n=1 Tax=Ornithinimicrobium cavernae TaxID=2666047 RepID=UPI002351A360|nr:very short patch repair endonuclease [Ornithinimicrobium cavernae]